VRIEGNIFIFEQTYLEIRLSPVEGDPDSSQTSEKATLERY